MQKNEMAYISRHAAVDNHGDHRTEENHDHKRIDQAEPMDTRVKDMEIVVPSSSLSRFKELWKENGPRKGLPTEWRIPVCSMHQDCL